MCFMFHVIVLPRTVLRDNTTWPHYHLSLKCDLEDVSLTNFPLLLTWPPIIQYKNTLPPYALGVELQ
jgi:hypothetical protein